MYRVVSIIGVVILLVSGAAFAQQVPPPQQTPPQQTPPPPPQPAKPAQAPVTKPFPEGSRVAFVDVQRIASESAEGKAATAKINEFQQKKTAELATKNKALEANQLKLSQSGSVMSESARSQLQKEIDKQQLEIQRAQQDAQAELEELNDTLQQEFQRKLAPLIQQIAAEKGLFILFSRADAGIVWIDPALDLTAEVIRRFDAARAAPKTTVSKTPAGSPEELDGQ